MDEPALLQTRKKKRHPVFIPGIPFSNYSFGRLMGDSTPAEFSEFLLGFRQGLEREYDGDSLRGRVKLVASLGWMIAHVESLRQCFDQCLFRLLGDESRARLVLRGTEATFFSLGESTSRLRYDSMYDVACGMRDALSFRLSVNAVIYAECLSVKTLKAFRISERFMQDEFLEHPISKLIS